MSGKVLRINGLEREFPDGELPGTLSDLLNALEICHATVVAEIDGKIVERKDFGATALVTGQKIELVRFVGGG